MGAYKSLVCAAEAMVRSLDQQLIHEGLTTAQYRALEALLLHGEVGKSHRHKPRIGRSASLASDSSTLGILTRK